MACHFKIGFLAGYFLCYETLPELMKVGINGPLFPFPYQCIKWRRNKILLRGCPPEIRWYNQLTTYFKFCATLKIEMHSGRFGAAHIQHYLPLKHGEVRAANRIFLPETPISNLAINTNSAPFKHCKLPREKPEMHQTIKRGIMATKLHSSPPSFLNR